MILERAIIAVHPGSELFARWRELIGPYFAAAPEVEHCQAAVVAK